MDSSDTWLAADKLQHFVFCGLVTVIVFVGLAKAELKHPQSLVLAGCVSFLAGLLKELGDYFQWWAGKLSLRDIAADITGIAAALSAITVFLTLQSRRPEALARARLTALYNEA